MQLKNPAPNNDLLEKILKLVNEHIYKHANDPLILEILGATATTFKNTFKHNLEGYWSIVLNGLENTNELTTFQATLSCICNFAKIMEPGFFKYANLVMAKLLEKVKTSLHR